MPESEVRRGRPRRRARSHHARARRGRAAARPDGRPAFPTRAGRERGARTGSTASSSSPASTFRPRSGRSEQESVVDLAGPGAPLTPSAQARTSSSRSRAGRGSATRSSRRGRGARRWRRRGARPPDARGRAAEVERRARPAGESLPAVAALVQLSDLGPLYYQFVYGVPAGRRRSRARSTRPSSSTARSRAASTTGPARNPTIVFQRSALVRALYREHGRDSASRGSCSCAASRRPADKQRPPQRPPRRRGGPGRRRGDRDDRRGRQLPHRRDADRARLRAGRRPDDGDRPRWPTPTRRAPA